MHQCGGCFIRIYSYSDFKAQIVLVAHYFLNFFRKCNGE